MACSVHYDIVPLAAKPSDLQLALQEYLNRQQQSQARQDNAEKQLQDALAKASALAKRTYQQSDQDATQDFLANQLTRLEKRILQLPNTVQAECFQQLTVLQQQQTDAPTLINACFHLAEKVGALQVTTQQRLNNPDGRESLHGEIATLREEIASTNITDSAFKQISQEITKQLCVIDALVDSQFAVAAQGVENARERFYRELRNAVERDQRRTHEQEIQRKRVDNALEKLQELLGERQLPEFIPQANSLLLRISRVLSSEPNSSQLSVMIDEVESLYAAYTKTLRDGAEKEFLRNQLIDAALSLGLSIKETAQNDESVITGMTPDLGIEFHLEQQGRVRAEMVAFNEDGAEVFPATIEEGITRADQVIERLKDRQCQVRERFRHLHKHPDGHRLRVVQIISRDQQTVMQATVTAPKQMRADL
ncbi:MAG TPA: hypothetical protein VHV83_00285 [Armatimonadota bacterium]|nr:hypothetical protein [Armatimonadota bacterium]